MGRAELSLIATGRYRPSGFTFLGRAIEKGVHVGGTMTLQESPELHLAIRIRPHRNLGRGRELSASTVTT